MTRSPILGRAWARWLPGVLWAGVLWWTSSLPALPDSPALRGDKAIHFAAYSVLGALLVPATGAATGAASIAAAYGIVDELHQSRVPGRTPDPLDWLADLLGASVGAWLAVRVLRRMNGTPFTTSPDPTRRVR